MNTTWKACLGNKQKFAVSIAFFPDPDRGKAATQAESLSWGSLELWVKGQNLCEHIEDDLILKSVNWYLLPFLEWVAQQWDP